MCIVNIFSEAMAYVLIFLKVYFMSRKFNFDEDQVILWPKKSLPIPELQRY